MKPTQELMNACQELAPYQSLSNTNLMLGLMLIVQLGFVFHIVITTYFKQKTRKELKAEAVKDYEEERRKLYAAKPHPRTAYALGHLDIKASPPKLVGIGIYSSSEITGIRGERHVQIVQADGSDYGEAKDNLMEQLEHPWHKWIKDRVNKPFGEEG